VRFTAHTYPDGSALGNRMLKRLRVGARIILRGSSSTLCYRVKRMKVTTPTRLGGYYNTIGRPKLAIVVCSGKRLGPGNWTNRTIWIARPFST
jgi:sortase (surface protein transpeptidase)